MPSPDGKQGRHLIRSGHLANNVPHILDSVRVTPRSLPLVPEITLYLMTDDYPAGALAQAEYLRLMQQPPYWAFCWGGGQALARWVVDNPRQVRHRPVADFGAGSGVAGIAAALAGASDVIAVDIDPDALTVTLQNAALNGVDITVSRQLPANPDQILLAADICYEDEGFAAVVAHVERGGHAIVAESRLRDLHQRFPLLTLESRYRVRTFPDLDEAEAFDEVHIYSSFKSAKDL